MATLDTISLVRSISMRALSPSMFNAIVKKCQLQKMREVISMPVHNHRLAAAQDSALASRAACLEVLCREPMSLLEYTIRGRFRLHNSKAWGFFISLPSCCHPNFHI